MKNLAQQIRVTFLEGACLPAAFMKMVEAIVKPFKLDEVRDAVTKTGVEE